MPKVDAIDCVSFEANGHGAQAKTKVPAAVLNSPMEIARAGGASGGPGLYVTADPGTADKAARQGSPAIRFGLGWTKSHSLFTVY